MADFKPGKKLLLTNGDPIIVKAKIGEGGQGSVYKVTYNGAEYALKWYLSNYLKSLKPSCKKFYENLSNNVKSGSPSSHFLWMKAVAATGKDSKGFGYIMDLRPKNYSEFTKFIKAKEHFANTQAVINAAINIVEAFQALHRKGYSYQDLSPGNFFIDKSNGDVLICDNDNVAPDGSNLGVGGTPGYMAPEVILGKEKPSTNTDLFSLSVILFELLFLAHPLEGENCCKHPCLTPKIERELYAEHPVFVCSTTDRSNGPVRGICSNLMTLWPIYPDYIHDAFQTAFSEEALHDGRKRKTEMFWRDILYRLLDDAAVCPCCGEINFASKSNGKEIVCTECHKKQILPYSIVTDQARVVAQNGKTLTQFHVSHGNRNVTIGTIVESKKTKGVYGLRNESALIWAVEYPEKPIVSYEPGKTVTLIPQTKITIGNKTIRIEE